MRGEFCCLDFKRRKIEFEPFDRCHSLYFLVKSMDFIYRTIGLKNITLLFNGIDKPRELAPFEIQNFIFLLSSSRLSHFDFTSITNSGHSGVNRFLSSSESRFHFSFETQDASGEKTERSGSMNPPKSQIRSRFFLFQSLNWPQTRH